jgi:hypothetical protein
MNMTLKLFIGKNLIDEWEVNFNYCNSLADREKELKKIADQMYWHHWQLFKGTMLEATFWFHVGSKMNYYETDSTESYT